ITTAASTGNAGQAAEKDPSASLAPSVARSTYREYASRAIFGRRLAAGRFSSLWLREQDERSHGAASLEVAMGFRRRGERVAVPNLDTDDAGAEPREVL